MSPTKRFLYFCPKIPIFSYFLVQKIPIFSYILANSFLYFPLYSHGRALGSLQMVSIYWCRVSLTLPYYPISYQHPIGPQSHHIDPPPCPMLSTQSHPILQGRTGLGENLGAHLPCPAPEGPIQVPRGGGTARN